MTLPHGGRLGHYDIGDLLGAGGMGEVYRARDVQLGREVALKILPRDVGRDPEKRARFQREAEAIASLNHPNIVTIYAVEEVDETHFMTMELVDGESLGALIPAHGFGAREFFEVALQLVHAVSAAHAKGVTHRDLKTSNVMVTRGGQVKVLDFGLAKLEQQVPGRLIEPGTDTLTLDGALVGTIPYMSPEQVQGKPADRRSDVFSLGVLLYEMAAGSRPFEGETPADVIASILRDKPRPLSSMRRDLPPRLGLVIERCLEKGPDHRFESALELSMDLESIRTSGSAEHPAVVPSIAVLPFADMSPEKDQEYFCEGIAEELINRLAKLGSLRVAARTSSFKFKDSALDIREIGEHLAVGHVVEGSVRRSENRLRITAQLISVADGYHLWSERYDRENKDVFAIQDDISQRIVEALRVTLTPRDQMLMVAPATTDVQAYDYYLRGRKQFYEYGRKSVLMALTMFTLARDHDPGYALAYAGIADCNSYLFMYADRTRKTLEEADAASRKALELAPDLPEAHASRGLALSLDEKHDLAEAEFQTAIALGPQLFEACYFYARDCFVRGQYEKAARLFERASEVRPDDYQSALLVAQVYVSLGRPADAEATRRRGVRIVEERLRRHPEDVRALYMGANALVALGETGRGLEWARLALIIEPDEPMLLYNIGCIYSLAGQFEDAITCLEQAYTGGLAQKGWYEHDSDLDPLRSRPRFQALLERIRQGTRLDS